MKYNSNILYNSNYIYNDVLAISSAASASAIGQKILQGIVSISATPLLSSSAETIVVNVSAYIITTAILSVVAKRVPTIVTYDDYITALKANIRKPIVKFEFLDNNENVIDSITPDLLDGTLSLQLQNGSRRSLNILLQNADGSYIPVPEGNLWINSKFRLWTGLNVNDIDYFNSRGIFVISQPEINSYLSEKTANLVLTDKWAFMDGTLGGTLKNDYIIPIGTPIQDVVKQVYVDAKEVKSPIIYPTSEITPYTITKSTGDTYGDILIELANMLSWEVYYDRNGYPRFQPTSNPDTTISTWDFLTTEVTFLGGSHKYDFTKVKNTVVVVGDNIDGAIFRATAQDTSVTSATRVALIGERVMVITDELINTNNLAQQRADMELKKSIAIFESVDAKCIPVDLINEGDVVTITDVSGGLNSDRCVVQNVSFPLRFDAEETMSIWKNRPI